MEKTPTANGTLLKWPPGFCFKIFFFSARPVYQSTNIPFVSFFIIHRLHLIQWGLPGTTCCSFTFLHHMQMTASGSKDCILTEPQLAAFQMVKSCLPNSFLSTPLLKTLFQTASRVVESRSQALAGQRLLTDNRFPLWVSCGQGNKSSEDLDWTNYGSVLRRQSDNKTEGGRWDRAKAEIKSAM